MANVDRPNGLRPYRYMSGAPYNGAFTTYVVPAADGTALFVGDPVKLYTAGDDTTGLRCVIQAAAGDALVGVVVGFEADPADLNTPVYRRASTRRVVFVADDPSLLFEAQEDGATDPLEIADLGQNVEFVVGSGSTVTGASGVEIDSDSHATTADHTLKLIELAKRADNEWVSGGQAYTRWVVKINNHQLSVGTGSAGV